MLQEIKHSKQLGHSTRAREVSQRLISYTFEAVIILEKIRNEYRDFMP